MNNYYEKKYGEYIVRIWHNNHEEWLLNNKFHRENMPAIIWADGTKMWYNNGILHKIGGPAIKRPDGSEEWILNGKRHRIDGASICSDVYIQWSLNGILISKDEYLLIPILYRMNIIYE